ncbi:AMP-binding protein [Labrys wisconsinensis]|uniref:Acetyl-CoA synthetase n=1 Tax=Labrys wisconsinensis TaxID=425677 RepID=A0ABU0IZQ7_9HYPH|nr:AMP-binding protein [Labrys wisconsinensis]MDQ0467500.1 acetyl-CoA synthetase [Labrys wisconsinensis]
MATRPTYDQLYDGFRWNLPARYNFGVDVCDKWAAADPGRPAILHRLPDRTLRRVSYGMLRDASNRLAGVLRAAGVGPGDRVAVLLPQSPEVVAAHAAAAKLGALSLPLAALFGPDALDYRLADSAAKAIVLDAAGLAKLRTVRDRLPHLSAIVCVDGPDGEALGYHEALSRAAPDFEAVASAPDDPAMMIYTSGTTGQPKGAVHGHRVVLGHLPGVTFAHHGLPRPDDLMWTPADWAWAGGLLNALLPSLSLGVPVVAWPHDRFVPEEALAMVRELGVRNAFLPPTALRMLKAAHRPGTRYDLPLRSIMSAGETLGPDTYAWAQEAFGFPVNELFGQTECNLVLGSSATLGVSRPGVIGRPVPGHRVAVIRPDGTECAPGEPGEIAVARPDPVMFLAYWNNPRATADKFVGDWMTTGDQAVREADGMVRFVGRQDDIITSSGYRIGPGEIEDCLMRHPAVAYAAAIGRPDALRTEIVKAFLVLKSGFAPSDALTAEIQAFVRTRLSAHEYPREVAYVAALPLTTSGKIIRRALREQG